MTGNELRQARNQLGLSTVQLGRALGLSGDHDTIRVSASRLMCRRDREIPLWHARLVEMMLAHGVPEGFVSAPDYE